jgi:hypothetical protein
LRYGRVAASDPVTIRASRNSARLVEIVVALSLPYSWVLRSSWELDLLSSCRRSGNAPGDKSCPGDVHYHQGSLLVKFYHDSCYVAWLVLDDSHHGNWAFGDDSHHVRWSAVAAKYSHRNPQTESASRDLKLRGPLSTLRFQIGRIRSRAGNGSGLISTGTLGGERSRR